MTPRNVPRYIQIQSYIAPACFGVFTRNPVHGIQRQEYKKVGQNSSVGIATRYRLDGLEIESYWVARFSAPVQTGSWGPSGSYTIGTGPFAGVKRLERGVDHPTNLTPRFKKFRAIPLLPSVPSRHFTR